MTREDVTPSLFTGELGPEEVDALLERAASDPTASDELDFLADLVAAAEERRAALEPHPLELVRGGSRRRRPAVWIATAAALLLAFVLVRGRTTDPPAGRLASLADLAPPVWVAGDLRAGTDERARAFAAAMAPYAERRWDAALDSLSTFLETYPEHLPARFYLGAVELHEGRLGDAHLNLATVSERATGLLADHAAWLRAQAALAAGDGADARTHLRGLVAGAGPFAARAGELLESLGNGTTGR